MSSLPTSDSTNLAQGLQALAQGVVSLAEVLDLHPAVLQRMAEQAVALIEAGKHDKGEPQLEAVAALLSNDAGPIFALGLARARRGAHRDAIEAFDEAARRAARFGTSAQLARAQLARAESHLAVGETSLATMDLSEATAAGDVEIARRASELLAVVKGERRS